MRVHRPARSRPADGQLPPEAAHRCRACSIARSAARSRTSGPARGDGAAAQPGRAGAAGESELMATDVDRIAVDCDGGRRRPAVAEIYRQGLEPATPASRPRCRPTNAWDRAHLETPRLVARLDDAIVGWAALSPVSDRCVYGGVAEDSVYVAAAARRGVGRNLLTELVRAPRRRDLDDPGRDLPRETRRAWPCTRGADSGRRTSREAREAPWRWRDVLLVERRSEA